MKQIIIRSGDIFWVDFDPSKDSEIPKTRPALFCSHDILNENSSRIIVAPITSKLEKIYSVEYAINGSAGLEGKIMLDQLRAIDKSCLGKKMGSLSFKELQEIEIILKFVFGYEDCILTIFYGYGAKKILMDLIRERPCIPVPMGEYLYLVGCDW